MDVIGADEEGHGTPRCCRVTLIDRDRRFRTALAHALSAAGFSVTGAYASARAALGCDGGDLLLVDPEGQHAADLEALSRKHRGIRRVILTSDTRYEPVIDHLRGGAVGLLSKDEAPEAMAAILLRARQGGAPLCSIASEHLLRALQRSTTAPPCPARLTSREAEVVGLLADGYGYDSIAATLGITLGTVQSHVKNLYRKLEVRTKSEAVAVALRAGLVPAAPGSVPS